MASYDIGSLVWKITGDTSGVDKSLKSADSGAKKVGASFVKTALAVGGAILAIKGLSNVFGTAIKKASDLQETTNKFNVVFADSIDQANIFAQTLQESYGLAKEESLAFLAGTGDILTGLGLQSDAALDLANSVATLGIDLASFSNIEGGSERAINALTTALTGEREALKAYGIVVSEELIKAELYAQGKDKLTGSALNQAKAEATVAIAYRQSGNAIGDMERSFDSFANIQKRINSQTSDFQATIGAELLPALSNLGLSFLSASKDGGIFSSAISAVTGFISDAIDGTAVLIAKLDQLVASSSANDMIEDNRELLKGYKANEQAVKDTFGSIQGLNKAAREGNVDAIKARTILELQKKSIQEKLALTQIENDKAKEKVDFLETLNQRINNSDKILDGNKAAIAAREQARSKETAEKRVKVNKEANKEIVKDQEESLKSQVETFASYSTEVGGIVSGLLSAFQNLYAARTQSDIDSLDAQLEAELEAAGVSDETTAEQAKTEYDLAVATGDALTIEDKRRALVKAQIEEKYQKRKRQLEYEGALSAWNFQLALAYVQAPIAILNAVSAGWKFGPIGAAAYGAAAAVTAGVQIAAVNDAKPEPPKFAGGGIIPGSAQGSTIIAGDGGTELVSNADQMANILSAIGNGGGAGGGLRQVPPLSSEDLFNTIWEASQNGDLFISERAVVSR